MSKHRREPESRRRDPSSSERPSRRAADKRSPRPEAAAPEAPPNARVIETLRPDLCRVSLDGEDRLAVIPGEVRARQGVVVGDDAVVSVRGERAVVVAIAPRRTRLSRPDPHIAARERVIVANVDVVVIVAGAHDPPFRPGLVDRYLVAIARGGAEAALFVNKADLCAPDDPVRDEVAVYASLGLPIMWGSAVTGEGIDALRAMVAGRTVAFVGHSGVGKSSLVRALWPGVDVAVGEVSDANARGTHTTTRATLHRLPDGTAIADTPGIRSFGLWAIGVDDLVAGFPDIAEHALGCRWHDCRHAAEPDCAVRDAVAAGTLAPSRWRSWRKLLAEAGGPPEDDPA